MIIVYSWPTSNTFKVHIMLEESGLRRGTDWEASAVDIEAGEQLRPQFIRINPNGKIPVLVDSQGPGGQPITVFESGAILLYLADKTGRMMPDSGQGRYQVLQWLMFQMSGLGPTLGQNRHFRSAAAERIEYAIQRYTAETRRLFEVMDARLAASRFIAGDEYTLADIAIFPGLRHAARNGMDWADFPRLKAWFDTIAQRPAVRRVLDDAAAPAEAREPAPPRPHGCTA